WYLRTGSISRPHLTPAGHSLDGGSFSPLMWLYERMAPGRELSRREAQHMHLFGGPRSLFAVAGAWVALIFLVVHQFVLWINSEPARPPRGPGHLLFMLPFLGFFLFSLGFATVRRARYLWLRERCDRTTLFGLAERLGLGASLTCWGVTAAIVLAISLAREPGRSHLAASYVIAHGAFSVCLFYGGMAMTRGWAVRDVLLAVVIGLWFFVQLNLLKPLPEATTSTAWVMTLAALLFAALLRWYAARQWRTLDWRIAMPPRPVARGNA